MVRLHSVKCDTFMYRNLVEEMIKPNKDGQFVTKMKGWYPKKVGVIMQTIQLKNHQTYYSKTMALLIAQVEVGQYVNWFGVVYQCLKSNMERWLLDGKSPTTLKIVQVVDFLLKPWFPQEGHNQLGQYINRNVMTMNKPLTYHLPLHHKLNIS